MQKEMSEQFLIVGMESWQCERRVQEQAFALRLLSLRHAGLGNSPELPQERCVTPLASPSGVCQVGSELHASQASLELNVE